MALGAWVFVHIPKTGGTSFRTAIEARGRIPVHRDYGASEHTTELVRHRVYGTADPSAVGRARLLAELDAAGPALLAGHFHLGAFPLQDSLDRVVTMVREPIAWALSRWEWEAVAEGLPLEEFIERPDFQNVQSAYLAGAGLDELGLVGVTDQLDRFVRDFGRLSGVWVEPRRGNVRDHDGRRVRRFPRSVIDEIRRRNAEDVELYEAARAAVEKRRRPLFSVAMPTFRSDPELLTAAVDSVRAQDHEDWELLIVDDGSEDRRLDRALSRIDRDPRIAVHHRDGNGGISTATNEAVSRARGDYIALLDHDDLLLPGALSAVRKALSRHPEADLIYSDQTKIDTEDNEIDVFRKPDWSPVYALGVMFIGHLLVVRHDLIERAGRCDPAFDGAQDFEWTLRLSAVADSILHVASPLYAWRAAPGSLASDPNAKPEAAKVQVRAARAHLDRIGASFIDVEPHPRYPHRLNLLPRAEVAQPRPPVSIVIPTLDRGEHLGRCLDSIERLSSYPDYEVVAVDGGSRDPVALRALERSGVRAIDGPKGQFSFSETCNLGVQRARGEVVILLNNDTEVLEREWIENLILCLHLPGVGAVGPMLTYPDGRVQHAGVGLGLRGSADHPMRGWDADSEGYAGSLCCAREVSAVTAAALCIRRQSYLDLGGLDTAFATHYQDVDLCLRLREQGHSIVYTPRPRLLHHEGVSRGDSYDFVDRALLIDRHPRIRTGEDPFFRFDAGPDRGPGQRAGE